MSCTVAEGMSVRSRTDLVHKLLLNYNLYNV